jgi:hypothetical protein
MKARVSLYAQNELVIDEYVEAGLVAVKQEFDKRIEVKVPKDEETFIVVCRDLTVAVHLGALPVPAAPKAPEVPPQNISVQIPYMDTVIEQMRKGNDWNTEFHRRWEQSNGYLSNIATNISSYFSAQVKLVEELTAELHWERIRNQNLEAENDRLRSLGDGKLLPVRAIRPKILLPQETNQSEPF